MENYKNSPDDYHCPPGSAGNAQNSAVRLPDLNKAFEAQNQDIVDKFAVMDRLLIMDTLAQLTEEEQTFLRASTVRKAGADFSRLDRLTGLPEEYFINGAKPAVQLLPGIDLFLAVKGGERAYICPRP
ncbi:hypothetical protein ABK905_13085 [Acerihabitans sp. KWT182]|uniref:Uncharacterized protein n=1 Tax=Acerihabitans sp. KWT182 TaxID=3157919 RepID=A0AAU7QF70_9GAMM